MKVIEYPGSGAYRKLKTINIHHITLMAGLSSLSWSGHLVHVSIPTCRLLDAGIQPNIIPTPADMLSTSILRQEYPEFGNTYYPDFNWSLPKGIRLIQDVGVLDKNTGSVHLGHLAAHHYYIAVCFILVGCALRPSMKANKAEYLIASENAKRLLSHAVLSVSLAVTGTLSIVTAHHLTAMPVYAFYSMDYPSVLCSFVHHI
jgi:photosystem I P700 chlorophyll a apoprotein A1